VKSVAKALLVWIVAPTLLMATDAFQDFIEVFRNKKNYDTSRFTPYPKIPERELVGILRGKTGGSLAWPYEAWIMASALPMFFPALILLHDSNLLYWPYVLLLFPGYLQMMAAVVCAFFWRSWIRNLLIYSNQFKLRPMKLLTTFHPRIRYMIVVPYVIALPLVIFGYFYWYQATIG
jgi:hypothetical protein